jgi:isopentenyl-diphosphate delta-isomerase
MKELNNPLIALVDSTDSIIGYEDKMKVHREGTLHRAFSIFIFNKNKELMLQQRAWQKYHSPGLWTNTCCSHLLQHMTMEQCIHDRLSFEMGFDCPMEYKLSFTYQAHFDNGLTEHETDHVYIGNWEGIPNVNPDEVAAYRWISIPDLKKEMENRPENFTYWFKIIMQRVEKETLF